MASTGRSVAIYNGLVYDVSTYLASPPAIMTPAGTQPPLGVDVDFMDSSILSLSIPALWWSGHHETGQLTQY